LKRNEQLRGTELEAKEDSEVSLRIMRMSTVRDEGLLMPKTGSALHSCKE